MNSPPARPPGGPPQPPPRRPLPSPVELANPFVDELASRETAPEAPNPFYDPPPVRSGGVVTSAPPLIMSSPEADSSPAMDAPFPLEGAQQEFGEDELPTPARGPIAAPTPPSPRARAAAAAQAGFVVPPAVMPQAAFVAPAALTPQAAVTPIAAAQGAPLRVQPGAVAPNIGDPHAEFRRGSFKKAAIFVAAAGLCGGGLFYGLSSAEPEAAPVPVNEDLRANAVIGASVSPEIIEDPAKTSPGSARPKPAAADSEADAPSPSRGSGSQGNFANSFKSLAK